MASTIYCDAEGCEAPADDIITKVATGDVLAFCDEHFVGFCIAMAANAEAELAELATVPDDGPQAPQPAEEAAQPHEEAPKRDAEPAEAPEEAAEQPEPEADTVGTD